MLPHQKILPVTLLCGCLLLSGCTSPKQTSQPTAPTELAAEPDSSLNIIRELEARVAADKEDFVAFNKLAGYYLQRLRETGDIKYLSQARKAIEASLRILPAEQNSSALLTLAQIDFSSHNFQQARDLALRLTRLQPEKTQPFQILADALLELGDYEGAAEAFQNLENRGDNTVAAQARLSKYDLLYGRVERAELKLQKALTLALEEVLPSREAVAWCRWQLGELAFHRGDYQKAEQHYNDSLNIWPDYYRAIASLGRVLSARGDLQQAISNYERVTRQLPDPSYVSTLGDLYKLAGREKEALAQYELVERVGHVHGENESLYNRQLALFYADHDKKLAQAYLLASREYRVRRDIYGADALAWTALKAGKLLEAQAAIKDALRLGTKDAQLYYHAGMIARAAGDRPQAKEYFQRLAALNPRFDPLQSRIAEQALIE